MSDLKIFACISLLALSASAASADHRYSGYQGFGCSHSNGYPQMSGGFGMNGQGYGPQGNYGGSAIHWNSGYGAPQRFNNAYYSSGFNGAGGFQDPYRQQPGYGYDMDDRRGAWGRSSYGYGSQNQSRSAYGFYDSLHGDYHVNSFSGLQHGHDQYRAGSQGHYHMEGANLNFGR